MMKEQKRINDYVETYGVAAINLAMQRHDLASEKRQLFSIRFVEEDVEKQAEITKMMDGIQSRIDELDWQLLSVFGVNDKLRTSITRDIKKMYPDGWHSGFLED